MANEAEPTSFLRILYRAALPAAVRGPLYSLRRYIFRRSNPEAPVPYSYSVPQCIPHVKPDVAVESKSQPTEQYPRNQDGVPTASACIVPAVDSRPQLGIPERMIVGNPPREQLYL